MNKKKDFYLLDYYLISVNLIVLSDLSFRHTFQPCDWLSSHLIMLVPCWHQNGTRLCIARVQTEQVCRIQISTLGIKKVGSIKFLTLWEPA